MEEKELFNYGDKELNVNSLLKYIDSNQQSYLNYYSNSISDVNAFIEKVNYIKDGIKYGNITTDGSGKYNDVSGNILENDELMGNALYYVDLIAKELSKKQRALTQSEIDQREQQRRQAISTQTTSTTPTQQTKLDFDPENPFQFEYSFKKQFGPTLEIPYDILKKSITKGADGKEDYSVVKTQFKNAFDSMRRYLNQYNNSDNYISQVNNLEKYLFDGVWDHRDELAIHQVGLDKDLNSLKDLFTYKLPAYNPRQNYKQQVDQVVNPGDFTVIDGDQKSILYLDEQGKQIRDSISDDEYYKLSGIQPPVVQPTDIQDQSLEELAAAIEDDQLGWEVLGPIVLDIYSIASPEPYSATGAGLVSDIIGIGQDIRNKGKFHWGQHGLNILATAAGIIPYVGDIGNVAKVGSKIVKASENINKFLATTSEFMSKLAKSPLGKTTGTTAGIAGTAWAYMDLTDEDSVILEQGKKALDAIKSGNITAENIIAVGNSLAMALQVRKGWKKFRSLDPSYVKSKPTKTKPVETNTSETVQSAKKKHKKNKNNETATPQTSTLNQRDNLIAQIKINNPKISKSDLEEITNALNAYENSGFFGKTWSKIAGDKNKVALKNLLSKKGKLSDGDIEAYLSSVTKHKIGGVLKASTGIKVPTKFDLSNIDYNSLNELTDFTQYDAKQMADVLNKIPADQYVFEGEASDNISSKQKAVADFLTRLKTAGNTTTGNGVLTYNSTINKWETSGWQDPSLLSTTESEVNEEGNEKTTVEGTSGTKKGPKVADLVLKQVNFKKQTDFNPDGILNSIAGYTVNEIANAKKQEIQKTIPIYQELPTPEKSLKTAYTYDLEKSKNEIMTEANSIKPITSDASQYYAARNEAIKNARDYTTKLDTEINELIHKTKDENAAIAFNNAINRTQNVNTNAKYRHDWEIEQKQGEVDRIEASNQSFQNLNKEIKHGLVTAARQKKKQRDVYAQRHLLKGITTTPSNYIEGWTKYHDLIWYKGQNNQLESDDERTTYQQLASIVQQAVSSIMAQYDGIKYHGMGELHVPEGLKTEFTPTVVTGAKGMKINKQKLSNFINTLK